MLSDITVMAFIIPTVQGKAASACTLSLATSDQSCYYISLVLKHCGPGTPLQYLLYAEAPQYTQLSTTFIMPSGDISIAHIKL